MFHIIQSSILHNYFVLSGRFEGTDYPDKHSVFIHVFVPLHSCEYPFPTVTSSVYLKQKTENTIFLGYPYPLEHKNVYPVFVAEP